MNDEILKPNRHKGMRKSFAANYGNEKLADEEQAEVEAAEAEMGTD